MGGFSWAKTGTQIKARLNMRKRRVRLVKIISNSWQKPASAPGQDDSGKLRAHVTLSSRWSIETLYAHDSCYRWSVRHWPGARGALAQGRKRGHHLRST